MNKNTTKRTYKHSDAWLVKHAAKADVKKQVKKDMKKPSKKIAKGADVKKHAKKDVKPVKTVKAVKPLKKQVKAEKPAKITMKEAVKVFNQTKKSVSALKKSTKIIGKFFNTVLKTGDQKYQERVMKLFARIDYVYTPENSLYTFENTFKVKQPKIKKEKTSDITVPVDTTLVEAPKKRRGRKAAAQKVIEPEVISPVPVEAFAEPTDDELAEVENTLEFDAIENAIEDDEISKRNDDEDEDEYQQRLEEERIIRENEEADRLQSEADIFGAAEDNGDI